MPEEKTSNSFGGTFAALSALSDRSTDKVRKALTAYLLLGGAYKVAKTWYDKAQAELLYTVAVHGNDAIYDDLHAWVVDQLPSNRRRSLTARSKRRNGEIYAQPVGERQEPEKAEVRLFYDGSRAQTVFLEGHKVTVRVEQPGTVTSGRDRNDMSDWYKERERTIFSAKGTEARDAVLALIGEITHRQYARKRIRLNMAEPWGSWSHRSDVPLRELQTVVLHKGQKEALVADMTEFLAAEEAYNRLGVPWHRGFLFEGPPGTGKTSLAKALAVHFDMDLYYIPLSSIQEDGHLLRLMGGVEPRSILLLEDIDIVHGARKRDDSSPGITLSGLLNSLDGLLTPHGLTMIMTTNDASVLDPALLRPGRVDRTEHLGHVDDWQFKELARMGLGVELNLVTQHDGGTPWTVKRGITPSHVVEVIKKNLRTGKTEAKFELEHLATKGVGIMSDPVAFPQPLPDDQHLFEPPPAIPKPPPEPLIVRGQIEITVDFEADVALLARRFPQEFEDVSLKGGYEEWERGSVFLHEYLAECVKVSLPSGEGVKGVKDTSWPIGPEIEFRWTQELAAELEARR